MNPHERQQFDLLLALSVERFVERLEQRNGGAGPALERLRQAPEGEGVWLSDFVGVLFQDFLLDDTAGACFVLEALERRSIAPSAGAAPIGSLLRDLARRAFAALLAAKAEEALEQHAGYQAVDTGGQG